MDDEPYLFDLYGTCLDLGDLFRSLAVRLNNTFFIFDTIGLALFTVGRCGEKYRFWAILFG